MDIHQHINFHLLPPDELADYLTTRNHAVCKQLLLVIEKHLLSADKEKSVPVEVMSYFSLLKQKCDAHFRKEEFIFFPYIKKMLAMRESIVAADRLDVSLVKSPISIIKSEHTVMNDLIAVIRQYSNDFSCPEGAPESLKLAYAELKELEREVQQGIYLENNILFPALLKIEEEILAKRKIA